MQASTQAPGATEGSGHACEQCKTENAAAARFCKQCGSALVPPPSCPFCQATVAQDARFCSACGTKLVGTRPIRRERERAQTVSDELDRAKKDETPIATRVAASAEVEALAANLPRHAPKSSILTNVLMFVAALAVFGVIMYAVNKDAPKETSPFQGPPAMQQMRGPQTPPVAAPQGDLQGPQHAVGGAAQDGQAVKGTITIDPKLGQDAPKNGTIFLSVRGQGMPERGPPVAAVKIEHPTFPVAFEIGPANVMTGLPFTGPFDVYVRLDGDGNAMTKEPGDLVLSSPKSGVTPGQTGVELVLDKRL
jgi:hypothetical protein